MESTGTKSVSGSTRTGTGAALDLTLTNFLSTTNYYRLGYILP